MAELTLSNIVLQAFVVIPINDSEEKEDINILSNMNGIKLYYTPDDVHKNTDITHNYKIIHVKISSDIDEKNYTDAGTIVYNSLRDFNSKYFAK